MVSTKPSLSLLRQISDETVLRALMDAPRLTRAEIAVATHLSKPTAGESIRRLASVGLVRDTGERTNGRGGVGSYFSIGQNVGVAIAVSIAPEGIVVERINPDGSLTARHVEPIGRPGTPRTVARLLTKAARAALDGIAPTEVRVAVVSAADPVDRDSGALVHLPDAPFLVGRLSPARTLAPLVGGSVMVDNDVNWAARAERDARASATGATLDDFVYLHLGEGLGCAVVSDEEVRRGHSGLTGEVAHLTVAGVDGRAVTFTDVFQQLGLRRAGSTAIDVEALLAAVAGGSSPVESLAAAVGDVITSAIAFCDPRLIVVGGAWGTAAPVFDAVRARTSALARSVPLERATAGGDSALAGARSTAIAELRADIIARSRTS